MESAKFILSQADSFLKSTVETTNILTGRAISVIQILIPLIGADFVYVLTFLKSESYGDYLFHIAGFLLIILCVTMTLAIRMFHIVKIADVGSEPCKLATENLLLSDTENQELILILNEIENYQSRIDLNLKNNSEKARRYRQVLNTLLVGFVLSALYASLSLFLWS